MARNRRSGFPTSDSLIIYDPDTQSWKIRETSLLGDWEQSLEALPKSGTMRNGMLFPQKTVARPIVDPERSLWPTPTAMDSVGSRRHGYMLKGNPGTTLTDAAFIHQHGESKRGPVTECLNPSFIEWLMGFPAGWTE